MIFRDEFIQQGEQGGQNAANQLWTALDNFVASNFPSITSPKIMTRIFANVKGLSELCVRAGIINEYSLLDDFVRGFNSTRALFDFVDVGAGKDSANDKIGGTRYVFIFEGYLVVCVFLRNGCLWLRNFGWKDSWNMQTAAVLDQSLTCSFPFRVLQTSFIQLPLSPDPSRVFA